MDVSELAERVAAEQARKMIEAALMAVVEAAKGGDEVRLAGFGKFKVQDRPQRKAKETTMDAPEDLAATVLKEATRVLATCDGSPLSKPNLRLYRGDAGRVAAAILRRLADAPGHNATLSTADAPPMLGARLSVASRA